MFHDLHRRKGQGPITNDDFNLLLRRLQGTVISPGPGMFMRRSEHGTTLWTKPPWMLAGRSTSCPFGDVYSKVADGDTDPSPFLRGGIVSGGTGNITVDDFNLGTDPMEDGLRFWVKVSFTALVDSGVLLIGGNVTAAEIDFGDSLPDNDPCTKDAPAGTYYVDLGDWQNQIFRPSSCGNITSFTQCKGTPGWARGV